MRRIDVACCTLAPRAYRLRGCVPRPCQSTAFGHEAHATLATGCNTYTPRGSTSSVQMLKIRCHLGCQGAPHLLTIYDETERRLINKQRTGVGVDGVQNTKIVLVVVKVHSPLVLQVWRRHIPLRFRLFLGIVEKLEKPSRNEHEEVIVAVDGSLADCSLSHWMEMSSRCEYRSLADRTVNAC